MRIKNVSDLVKEGWKYSDSSNKYYLGYIRFPLRTFGAEFAHLLGSKVKVIRIYKGGRYRDHQKILILKGREEYIVPRFLLIGEMSKIKTAKSPYIKGKKAIRNGDVIEFPCGFDELRIFEAKKLARWVLKLK